MLVAGALLCLLWVPWGGYCACCGCLGEGLGLLQMPWGGYCACCRCPPKDTLVVAGALGRVLWLLRVPSGHCGCCRCLGEGTVVVAGALGRVPWLWQGTSPKVLQKLTKWLMEPNLVRVGQTGPGQAGACSRSHVGWFRILNEFCLRCASAQPFSVSDCRRAYTGTHNARMNVKCPCLFRNTSHAKRMHLQAKA